MANKKTKNKGNVKSPNQEKTIKRIFFTREQLMMFLNMEDKEAGEFILSIARYVADGTYPSFKDHYKMLFFETTFGNALKEQLRDYEVKKSQCQQMAEKRSTDNEIDTDTDGDDSTDSVSITQESNDTATTTEKEYLSYSAFESLYVKKDAGNFDTKSRWNALTDDDKRKALTYIKNNIVGKIDVAKREFPSAFINGNKWK